MATRQRRRSRRSRIKSRSFSIGNKMFPVAKALSAPVAFIEQISAKHRQNLGSAFSNAPTTQKLKILANTITGSITGVNFFSNEYQAPQTINPAGILNKWTSAGALLIGYGIVGKHVNKMLGSSVLPATPKIQSIGKSVLIGGALGGFFDDPESRPTSNRSQGTRQLSPQLVLQTRGNRFSSSGDSTESGL